MIRALVFVSLVPGLAAQSIEGPTFEVASLKRVGETSRVINPLTGGPGTISPDRVTMLAPLGALVVAAFGLPSPRLIIEARSPALNEFYELSAILPEGARKEDLPAMYRNLLIERFHMRFHTETREVKQYELVEAPGGHKLKASAGEPPPVPRSTVIGTPGPDGYPTLPPGYSGAGGMRGKWALQRPNATLDEFARDVEGRLGDGTVVNRTGISGRFDIAMRWASPGPAAAAAGGATEFADPPFLPSLREQLGLIVRESRGLGEVTVIDAFDAEAAPN